jgi:hypothetical protein
MPGLLAGRQEAGFVSDRSGDAELWTVDVPGFHPVPLTAFGPGSRQLATPVWSPDGSEILYVEEKSGERDFNIVPAAGGPPRRVMRASAARPQFLVWLPPASTNESLLLLAPKGFGQRPKVGNAACIMSERQTRWAL